ncbi:MAG TPA: prolyl oligopeptidase family serine peptidase, partial [Pyrinomonadaceae bacterium]|nr:prolyl oligopeptidase family serine peptidase [Pyrinomonadaceae bacterium]
MPTQRAPYGSWKSPITSDLIVQGTVGLGQILLDGADTFWAELRPSEAGRVTVVRRTNDGRTSDLVPAGFNARTRVPEYGGGSYVVADGGLYFSNFADQRLYRVPVEAEPPDPDMPAAAPLPVTPAVDLRYADAVYDAARRRLLAVREDHTAPEREAVNTIVGLDLENAEANDARDSGGHVLVSGSDFYSSPRLSPDGTRLCWLQWNHPNMPWDGCELWVGTFDSEGAIARAEKVAGGADESIFQPEWSPDGRLYFVSDRSGWWNLRRWNEEGKRVEPLCELDAEFGTAQWIFGMSTYAFADARRVVCAYARKGAWALALLDADTGRLEDLETPYTDFQFVRADAGRAVFLAGSPTERASIVELDLSSRELKVLRRSGETNIDAGYLSVPEPVEFPTEDGRTAHAIVYRPRNRDYEAPEGERPPLLVKCHGGPTAATTTTLRLEIQYWTSRGVAVLDVNYGGSTGYGREYRQRLDGRWGIVDIDDCVNGARHLAGRGEIDGERCAITGGSAGGYTTLGALTFRDFFKAGASHFGVSDLAALVRDTHKFESRYLD